MNENVIDMLQVYEQCNKIVTDLIAIRKQANLSQEFMAEWLGVSRKKMNEFEKGDFDFKLLAKYADKLSVTINITHTIN